MGVLPIVVVGAGPAGLAAAAELVERGEQPLLLERGAGAGAAVREWGHVRLFSPWSELVSPAAARLLEPTGWRRPDPYTYPTGLDWVQRYLEPLAAVLGDRVRFGAEVIGVARRGRDRVVDAGRDSEPLTVHVRDRDGAESRVLAQAVIDASGTWGAPSPLGGDGLPALGERAAADRLSYRCPDLADPASLARYAGKQVAIVGSGHSALTALVLLTSQPAGVAPAQITWVLRRGDVGQTFGGGEADQLPARGALGIRARQAVEGGRVRVVYGFRTDAVETAPDGRVTLVSTDGDRVDAVDEMIVLTGFRPDLSWLSEVRLDLDATLQAPTRLAPLVDPNVHSCGTVYPHGFKELAHPEPGVYLVGMKSYGRAPTFLALTGYEQVRSVAAAIAGDVRSAERVELELPETGVCGGSGLADADSAEAAGCCGPTDPGLISLTVPARV
ncbi:MAG: SidA/IucD/PvdA family monooxygenase [Propionibacteriales bacterium]|nr:SidA/IucD/PvdA family monooxygenase [Propionibacteriales bacterium]